MLAHVLQHRCTQRSRAMLLTGLRSGMRVGEMASLRIGHAVNANGTVKSEVRTAFFVKSKQFDNCALRRALLHCQPALPGRAVCSVNQALHYLV